MQIEIFKKTELPDGCDRYWLRIPSKEYVTAGFLFESLEGRCNYSTVKKGNERYMEVTVSPDFKTDIEKMIEYLKKM
ncbi:MAG: hypothetical protein CSB55_06005 [Candidatus Cloacimonadota bacterium]|nr:MAG: hypothetical protein CSB55_06005 [Candidatus Cloacimonadota bacterium]